MDKNKKNKRIDFFIEQFMGMSHLHEITERGVKGNHRNSNNGWNSEEIDPSKAIKRNFKPNHPFLLDFGSDIEDETSERLFAPSRDYLVSDMKELVGNGFESALLNGLSVIWVKVVPTDLKRLKGISAFKHDAAFEWHYRVKYFDGSGEYIKRIVATYKNNPVPVFYNGLPVENVYNQLVVLCSVKEDIYRSGVFHAKFTNADTGKGLTMALSGNSVIELMKFREAPRTESGRKRPILHWVKEHLRNCHNQNQNPGNTRIDSYERGVDSFESDGCLVSIQTPAVTFEKMRTKR